MDGITCGHGWHFGGECEQQQCAHEWEQVWIDPTATPPKLVGPFRCRKCRVVKAESIDARILKPDGSQATGSATRTSSSSSSSLGDTVGPETLMNIIDPKSPEGQRLLADSANEQPMTQGDPPPFEASEPTDTQRYWMNELARERDEANRQRNALQVRLDAAEQELAKGSAFCSWCDWKQQYQIGTESQEQAATAMREHVRSCPNNPSTKLADPASLFMRAVERAEAAEATLAQLRTLLKELTDHMDRAGGDGYGMPECPWCRCQFDDNAHKADCELVKARALLGDGSVVIRPIPYDHEDKEGDTRSAESIDLPSSVSTRPPSEKG